jgi:hypothetical protein
MIRQQSSFTLCAMQRDGKVSSQCIVKFNCLPMESHAGIYQQVEQVITGKSHSPFLSEKS